MKPKKNGCARSRRLKSRSPTKSMIIYKGGRWRSDSEPEPRGLGTAIAIGICLAVVLIAAYL